MTRLAIGCTGLGRIARTRMLRMLQATDNAATRQRSQKKGPITMTIPNTAKLRRMATTRRDTFACQWSSPGLALLKRTIFPGNWDRLRGVEQEQGVVFLLFVDFDVLTSAN